MVKDFVCGHHKSKKLQNIILILSINTADISKIYLKNKIYLSKAVSFKLYILSNNSDNTEIKALMNNCVLFEITWNGAHWLRKQKLDNMNKMINSDNRESKGFNLRLIPKSFHWLLVKYLGFQWSTSIRSKDATCKNGGLELWNNIARFRIKSFPSFSTTCINTLKNNGTKKFLSKFAALLAKISRSRPSLKNTTKGNRRWHKHVSFNADVKRTLCHKICTGEYSEHSQHRKFSLTRVPESGEREVGRGKGRGCEIIELERKTDRPASPTISIHT